MKSGKVITLILVIGLGLLAFINYNKRVELARELDSIRLTQSGDGVEDAARAQEIIQKVKRHIMIIGDVEPTVAQVVDADALKQNNNFYQNAENGDFLVITPVRAMLYSEQKDILLDVVPVQLTAPQEDGAPAA